MSTATILAATAAGLFVAILLLIAGARMQAYVSQRRQSPTERAPLSRVMPESQVEEEELAALRRIESDPRHAGLPRDQREKAAREMRVKAMEKLGLSTSKRRKR